MNNDRLEPPMTFVQVVQAPNLESPPRICKDNHTIVNQPPKFNSLNVPTSTLGGSNGPHAPDPMTLQERHQSALRQVHALQAQNTKLYDDNCRLVNTINALNDRLTFFGEPHNVQLQLYADVQQKLRTSEESRALLNRKYQELLQCIPAGSAQHCLSVDLQSLKDAYASLDRNHCILREKYVRLRASADQSRIAQQHSQASTQGPARCLVPPIHSDRRTSNVPFRALDQNPSISTSPTSSTPQGFMDQGERHRRRSSEGLMAQLSLRSGSAPIAPIATSWATPLPTPPPSAPLPASHLPQPSFPVHAPVPAGSLRYLHHAQAARDPHSVPSLPSVPQSRHSIMPSVSEQLKAAITLRQRCDEKANPARNQPVSCDPSIPIIALSDSTLKQKRPSSEVQTYTSPEEKHKKPRIEEVAIRETKTHVDTSPGNNIPDTDEHPNQCESSVSGSEAQSEEECVNIIFEQDAEIPNGVFCALCLDRFQAKMIPEPPDVLVHPEFNMLLTHCMTMHPAVWEKLRHKSSS